MVDELALLLFSVGLLGLLGKVDTSGGRAATLETMIGRVVVRRSDCARSLAWSSLHSWRVTEEESLELVFLRLVHTENDL